MRDDAELIEGSVVCNASARHKRYVENFVTPLYGEQIIKHRCLCRKIILSPKGPYRQSGRNFCNFVREFQLIKQTNKLFLCFSQLRRLYQTIQCISDYT